ncbi:MAG: tRNA dimethylallyltransferase [Bacteroidales bacterium]|nr:tRNA dimethylallyltransferase [Bacteroidales bacterium]
MSHCEELREAALICVLGPTASGKTAFAVRLARSLGVPAEIISADSRQVYRGMDIGTGKDLCEYGEIPYHLIDIVDAGEQYNVYRYKEDFLKAYRSVRERGAVPILCGGTGLYISAVTGNYDFSGNTPLSDPARNSDPYHTYFIGMLVDRDTRNARIDARLDARLSEGMVEEIQGLLDAGVPAERLISYGLEYKFVTKYLLGELDYAQMRDLLAIAIHQFAKRQMTWFRGMERSGIKIHWTKP